MTPFFFDPAAQKNRRRNVRRRKKCRQSPRTIFARLAATAKKTPPKILSMNPIRPAEPARHAETTIPSPGGIFAPPPLSLYVHLPWCAKKCPYCDFNSHQAPQHIPEKQYAAALLADAETLLPALWGRRPRSVFIGGGTPSMFSPAIMDAILCGLRARGLLPPDAEITLEANPDSADAGKFAEFAAAGINRLSLGVQSFDDNALAALGRIHNGKTSRRAAEAAALTFANFNIDLMHALPAQTAEAAVLDIKTALAFSPPHLSLYQLTLEPGTPFFRRPPPFLPPPDNAADIGDAVFAAAENAGFCRYEISAFARPQRECRHNLNYWLFGDYAGIGAGAHGKITSGGKIFRQTRIKHPGEYMRRIAAGEPAAEERAVPKRDAAFEFMLNALRLPAGFPPSMLLERAGIHVSALDGVLTSCEKDGLLFCGAHVVKPSAKGLRYLNDLLLRFLPEPAPSGG